MTTQQVADRLIELCNMGKYEEAQKELYAEDAVSLEPADVPGMQSVEGLDKILQKAKTFEEMVEEVHDSHYTEPIVLGNHISVGAILDVTMKGVGRSKMEEVCVYEVKDGKVVKEQFFYSR